MTALSGPGQVVRARRRVAALFSVVVLAGASAAAVSTAPSAGAAASICDAIAGNLVQNCGFETGSFANWTLSGNTSFTMVQGIVKNSGASAAQIAPAAPPGFLKQTLSPVVGQPYRIEFWLWNNLSGTNYFNASISGVDVGGGVSGTQNLYTVTNDTNHDFQNHAFIVTPVDPQTTISFEYSNQNGIFVLDDVSMAPQGPPPTTTTTSTTSTTTTLPSTTTTSTAPTSTTTSTTLPGGPTCNGKAATIVGTPGADRMFGTPGDDVIVGLGGADSIYSYGGDDTICAGDGNDYIDGGAGNDTLVGDAGNDIVLGGDGSDRLFASAGTDTLNGGVGVGLNYCYRGTVPGTTTFIACDVFPMGM